MRKGLSTLSPLELSWWRFDLGGVVGVLGGSRVCGESETRASGMFILVYRFVLLPWVKRALLACLLVVGTEQCC